MAKEIIEMEARLKNHISKNVKDIKKDLIGMGKSGAKSFAAVDKGASTFMNTMKGMVGAQAIIGGVKMAWRGLQQLGRESIALAKEQVDSEQKLSAALRATGGVVGITKQEMMAYATQLQSVTTIGDETVIKAQALMVTFKKIGKDVFPEAIKAAADMSAMFGQDMSQSAVQLGIALNDPITGISRLKKIGITFSESQKESIARFVEQNDIMSAQKIILGELQTEFGGVAEELANTDVGRMEQSLNLLNDQKEVLGKDIIPLQIQWNKLMTKTISLISETASGWSFLLEKADRTEEGIKENAEIIRGLSIEYKDLKEQIDNTTKSGRETVVWMDEFGFRTEKIAVAKAELKALQEQIIDFGPRKGKKAGGGDAGGGGGGEAAKKAADEKTAAKKKALDEWWKIFKKEQNEELKYQSDSDQKQAAQEASAILARQDQIIASEITLRDTKIALMEEGKAKELAILDTKYADTISSIEGNEEAITNIRTAAKLERDELIAELDQQAIEAEQARKFQNFEMINSAAQNLGSSIIALSRQSRLQTLADEKAKIANMNISEKQKEALLKKAEKANKDAAKKERAIALIQAGVNVALGISGALATKPTVLGLVLATLVGAAGAVQIAAIASAKYAKGGFVGGNSPTGDNVPISANSGELILNRQQQGELFRIAQGQSTVNNNQRNVNIALQGSATQADADLIVETLMEAEREGNLDDFKLRVLAE